MSNWKTQQVKAQLVYALKHKDSAEPHEEALLDLLVKFEPTDPNEMSPLIDKAILGLANIGTIIKPVYQLHRLKGDPQVTFEFDDPSNKTKSLGSTFRVAVQLSGPQDQVRSFTIPYPFKATDDRVRKSLPGTLDWKYLLIRQENGEGYVLAYESIGGPADEKCEDCNDPEKVHGLREYQECFLKYCYP